MIFFSFKVIGTLAVQRERHVVIEVPAAAFCPLAGSNPEPTPTPEPTTTPEPATTAQPPPEGLDETAVLIVGGYNVDLDLQGAALEENSVELFGCPSAPAFEPAYLPLAMLGAGGTYVHDDEGGFVMVCGGNQCRVGERPCYNGDRCFRWTPRDNRWIEIDDMNVSWLQD